jgi:autotransporter translocation and assembly factor TamB
LHQLHRAPTAFPIQSVTDIALRVEGVQLGQLAPLLPKSVPVSGELSLQAQAAGSWPEVRGDGEVTFRGLMVHGEPMGHVVVMGTVSPAQLTVKRLVATVGGGQVQAQGMAMLHQRMVDIAVTWQGVQLGRIAFLQDLRVPVSGALSGHVRARGIWPNLRAEVTAEGPQLRAYGLEIADLQLSATGSRHALTLDRLSTRIAGARLAATGHAAIGGSMELRLSSDRVGNPR